MMLMRFDPSNNEPKEDIIPFILPFISNEVSTAIKRCLRRADLDKLVRVVEIPLNNLDVNWSVIDYMTVFAKRKTA